MFIGLQLALVAFGVVIGWRLRVRQTRVDMTDVQRSDALAGHIVGLTVQLLPAWFMQGFAPGYIAATLAVYLPSMQYLFTADGTLAPPRFSLKFLFGYFTIVAVLLALMIGLDQYRIRSNRETAIRNYRQQRRLLETNRDRLSPAFYRSQRSQLEAEAKRLGID